MMHFWADCAGVSWNTTYCWPPAGIVLCSAIKLQACMVLYAANELLGTLGMNLPLFYVESTCTGVYKPEPSHGPACGSCAAELLGLAESCTCTALHEAAVLLLESKGQLPLGLPCPSPHMGESEPEGLTQC